MTFKESVKLCLGPKYLFKFRGRASRSEFWWFMLFIFIVNVITGFISGLLPPKIAASLSLAVSLLLFPPNIGVTVRRFHDRNLSGWWLLVPIFSLIGWVLEGGTVNTPKIASSLIAMAMVLCYLGVLMLPSQPGPNKYGPNPLQAGLKDSA